MKRIIKAWLVAVFLLSTAVSGCDEDGEQAEGEGVTEVVAIADTGQMDCASGEAGDDAMDACGAASVMVPGQDGSYVDIPGARSFSGPTAYGTFTADHATGDQVTGLIWRACTQGQELDGASCDGTVEALSWEGAAASCEALNGLNSGSGYAGISNWRLPTISELRTLVNYGQSDPAIDTQVFPDTASNWYWSSSQHRNPLNAFAVNFESGNVLWWTKQDPVLARCVADDAAGGSPVDLVWTKCSMEDVSQDPDMDTSTECTATNGRGTWQDALAACESLDYAGRTDWRLPSVAELHSLIDVTQTEGVFIDLDTFPDTPGTEAYYWSSTTYQGLPYGPCQVSHQCAWYVNFNDGYVEGVKIRSQKDSENYVRCVAGP